MSRQPRFEIVQTDAGWTARFRASNGKIIMSSGRQVYAKRDGALNAVLVIARAFWGGRPELTSHPAWRASRVWEETTGQSVEVSEVDERTEPPC